MMKNTELGSRIIILGSPGSGKTYFSNELARITQLPIIHLDDLYWDVEWQPMGDEKWIRLLESLVKEDKYIIDGNYSDSIDIRAKHADNIIYIDTPLLLCIYRIFKRTFENKYCNGKHLPKKIREEHNRKKQKASKDFWSFILYIVKYHFFSKKILKQKLIKEYSNKTIILKINKIEMLSGGETE